LKAETTLKLDKELIGLVLFARWEPCRYTSGFASVWSACLDTCSC